MTTSEKPIREHPIVVLPAQPSLTSPTTLIFVHCYNDKALTYNRDPPNQKSIVFHLHKYPSRVKACQDPSRRDCLAFVSGMHLCFRNGGSDSIREFPFSESLSLMIYVDANPLMDKSVPGYIWYSI